MYSTFRSIFFTMKKYLHFLLFLIAAVLISFYADADNVTTNLLNDFSHPPSYLKKEQVLKLMSEGGKDTVMIKSTMEVSNLLYPLFGNSYITKDLQTVSYSDGWKEGNLLQVTETQITDNHRIWLLVGFIILILITYLDTSRENTKMKKFTMNISLAESKWAREYYEKCLMLLRGKKLLERRDVWQSIVFVILYQFVGLTVANVTNLGVYFIFCTAIWILICMLINIILRNVLLKNYCVWYSNPNTDMPLKTS
jgi:hypothetical protein